MNLTSLEEISVSNLSTGATSMNEGIKLSGLASDHDLTPPVTEGSHVLNIHTSDKAGNWVSQSFQFILNGQIMTKIALQDVRSKIICI